MVISQLLKLFRLRNKSQKELKSEVEKINNENYRNHKREFHSEFLVWKDRNKRMLEYYIKKPIDEMTEREAVLYGFNSIHLTRKHCEEMGW